jgi:hypothetical protein
MCNIKSRKLARTKNKFTMAGKNEWQKRGYSFVKMLLTAPPAKAVTEALVTIIMRRVTVDHNPVFHARKRRHFPWITL